MTGQRAEAIESLAEEIYNGNVPRTAPSWGELDDGSKFRWRELANGTINKVLSLVTPVDPDIEVMRLRLRLSADELEQVPIITGVRAAEMLRYAAEYQPLSDEDPPGGTQ